MKHVRLIAIAIVLGGCGSKHEKPAPENPPLRGLTADEQAYVEQLEREQAKERERDPRLLKVAAKARKLDPNAEAVVALSFKGDGHLEIELAGTLSSEKRLEWLNRIADEWASVNIRGFPVWVHTMENGIRVETVTRHP